MQITSFIRIECVVGNEMRTVSLEQDQFDILVRTAPLFKENKVLFIKIVRTLLNIGLAQGVAVQKAIWFKTGMEVSES
jgi:ribosomal protein L7/L12